jgi:hypothetical protein
MKETLKRINRRANLAYLKATSHPIARRSAALLKGDARVALEREEGQGLTEYVIGIAGVFVVALTVFGFYRALRSKYAEATNSVNQIQISAP